MLTGTRSQRESGRWELDGRELRERLAITLPVGKSQKSTIEKIQIKENVLRWWVSLIGC